MKPGNQLILNQYGANSCGLFIFREMRVDDKLDHLSSLRMEGFLILNKG